MDKAKEELLKKTMDEYLKDQPARNLKQIEEFWPHVIQQLARMLEAGPGPGSKWSESDFSSKIVELTRFYEAVYHEIFAGRENEKTP